MIARVSIRPDICIALRIIALQELARQTQEFLDQLADTIWERKDNE